MIALINSVLPLIIMVLFVLLLIVIGCSEVRLFKHRCSECGKKTGIGI